MRSAALLWAIACLVVPASPAAAQSSPHETSDGGNRDWSRVRKLAPGTEINLTVQGSEPAKRIFVQADESTLTVLKPDAALPPDAVRRIASNHPEDLAAIVDSTARSNIVEILISENERNVVGCAVAAYFGGAVVGALPGVLIGHAVGRDTGPALVGMVVGWSSGAGFVYRRCRHPAERIIYRAATIEDDDASRH